MRTVIGKQEKPDIGAGMKEDGHQNALAGVVIDPYDDNPQKHGNQTMPYNPRGIVSGLNPRNNMPYRLYCAANNASRQSAPSLLKRIDDKGHPARFFPHRADEEYGK
jgi:hypothetical protein